MSDSRTGSGTNYDANNEHVQHEESELGNSEGAHSTISDAPNDGAGSQIAGSEVSAEAQDPKAIERGTAPKSSDESKDAEEAWEEEPSEVVPAEETDGDLPSDAEHLASQEDSAEKPREADAEGQDEATDVAKSDVEHDSELAEDADLESDNPYDAYAALDPYADDDSDDEDDGSDVTDYEARAYRTASQYSRTNAAQHYERERKSVLLPVTVALVAGVVVLAGVLAFLFGSRPATLAMLESLGFNISQSQPAESDDDTEGDDAATPAAEPVDINLTMVGDVLVQPSVLSAAQTSAGDYDFTSLFSNVADDIKDADVALVDQESSMAGQSYGYASNVPYNAPDSLGTAEKDAGLDVVLKASNYALDLGYNGLHAELQTWGESEPSMQVLGVADPNGTVGTDRVNNVYLYEKDGFKVAILNYTYGTDVQVSSSTDSSYVATLSEDKVKADVEAARNAGADMIVACPHWGVEYSTTLSNEETTYAQLFANEGVDVVLGDHPHVVQPVQVITNSDGHTCVCFYSVGNFVSGTRTTAALVGSLAKVTLHKDADGTCSVTAASLVPVVTHRANGTNFGVYRLSNYTDDLARQGWDTALTPDYVRSLLDQVLGLDYDEDSGAYQVDLSNTTSVDDIASSAAATNNSNGAQAQNATTGGAAGTTSASNRGSGSRSSNTSGYGTGSYGSRSSATSGAATGGASTGATTGRSTGAASGAGATGASTGSAGSSASGGTSSTGTSASTATQGSAGRTR